MSWHLWTAFAVASAAIGVIPGPGVTSIVGYAIGSGRRTALASAAGMAVGNAIAITCSLRGVGALLAASALAFSAIKWIGAAYLIGLGVLTIWRAGVTLVDTADIAAPRQARSAFLRNVAVGTFHPKTIAFFVAFLPQFIDRRGNYVDQATLLAVTFCVVVLMTDTAYALAASGAARLLRRSEAAIWSRRLSGGVLIAAGVATAAAHD